MRESSKREEAARGKGEAEGERAEWNWTPGRSFVAAKWVVPSFETMLRRLQRKEGISLVEKKGEEKGERTVRRCCRAKSGRSRS